MNKRSVDGLYDLFVDQIDLKRTKITSLAKTTPRSIVFPDSSGTIQLIENNQGWDPSGTEVLTNKDLSSPTNTFPSNLLTTQNILTVLNKDLSSSTNTFPSSFVTQTGTQTLTNKDLTSDTNTFPETLVTTNTHQIITGLKCFTSGKLRLKSGNENSYTDFKSEAKSNESDHAIVPCLNDGTDTFVMQELSQTLTNKNLASVTNTFPSSLYLTSLSVKQTQLDSVATSSRTVTFPDKSGTVLLEGIGWKDLISSVASGRSPPVNAPTWTAFGVSGSRYELAFALNDYVVIQPFHVNHDVKPGGKAYVHVHWTTNGTQTRTVRWEFEIIRALGHNQENFGAPVSKYVEQAAAGTAWRHMVTEVADADALTLVEPDELILVTLRRVTNGGTNNTDTVFGLTVDFHYESDRDFTPKKAPNFYS